MASAPTAGSSSTNSCPCLSRRPDTTTCAPSCAKITAAARPIPVSAPVIRTTGLFILHLLQDMPVWYGRVHRKTIEKLLSYVFFYPVIALPGQILVRWEPYLPGMGNMELRHLRYFVAFAEAGSLTVAATRKLHTAQPSLSRQIRDLENEVGTQ